MNDQAIYIDGQQAVELNNACKDYDRLKTAYEEAIAEFEKVQKTIKEICQNSKQETSKYMVKMKITPDTTILDTKKVAEKYPEIFAECQKPKKGSTSIMEVLKK